MKHESIVMFYLLYYVYFQNINICILNLVSNANYIIAMVNCTEDTLQITLNILYIYYQSKIKINIK